MLILKGFLDNTAWEKIGEGTYQRLKEIRSFADLCKKIEGNASDTVHMRLGRAVLKSVQKNTRFYCEEISPERDFVSGYVITASADSLEITMHQLRHSHVTWVLPWQYFAPVIFSYYSSPSDIVYEEILNKLCHSATRSQ